MPTYKIVYEIEIEADSPLRAAKEAQDWLRDSQNNWQFYVQEEGKDKPLYSVDLCEEDIDAVLPVDEYQPMIKERQVITGT